MPLATLTFQITPTGISAPTYAEILQSLQESFCTIYGDDIYIAPDSQDGQLLALFARAYDDMNQQAIALYNSYSPTYAQGAALSSEVKINGISRHVASFSTATGRVVGVAGTEIIDGVVRDDNGLLWDMPTSVLIPVSGEVIVSVTAQEAGDTVAPAGTINTIENPQVGWQTFESVTDASPGSPVETDAALRRRQAISTAISSETPLAGVLAAVANLDNVTRSAAYENYTGSVDSNGLPPHSISVVVEGGDAEEIAETIGQKKTPGANTYGTTSQSYTDPRTGVSYVIDYFTLDYEAITVTVDVTSGTGWNTNTIVAIQEAVAAYVNSLGIGEDLEFNRLYRPAYLNGSAEGLTYTITGLQVNGGTSNVSVDFNKAADMEASDVTVNVTP